MLKRLVTYRSYFGTRRLCKISMSDHSPRLRKVVGHQIVIAGICYMDCVYVEGDVRRRGLQFKGAMVPVVNESIQYVGYDVLFSMRWMHHMSYCATPGRGAYPHIGKSTSCSCMEGEIQVGSWAKIAEAMSRHSEARWQESHRCVHAGAR
jgi:hypothetical protein